MIEQVEDLSQLRTIGYEGPQVLEEFPDIQFELVGRAHWGESEISARILYLGVVRLTRAGIKPTEAVNYDRTIKGGFNLVINRKQNLLSVFDSHHDISVLWSNHMDILSVKKTIFRAIKKHLESRPDGPVIFFPDMEKAPVESGKEDTVEAVEAVMVEAPKLSYGLSELKGINDRELKRALIKILGGPIRISGSHHIFESRITGRVPVPIHNRTTPTGTLKVCLEALGVSPAEIKDAL